MITNCRFTHQAQEMAQRLDVELWDRDRLVQELAASQQRVTWEEYLLRFYVD